MNKILPMIGIALLLTACAGKPEANSNSGGTAASQTAASSANVNAPNVNAGVPNAVAVNKTSNLNVRTEPADLAPQRIAFGRGADWGATNVTLAPGAARRFVVGAKRGQAMDVETSSKETSVNLIKGKAETTEDLGFLNAALQANGDYVFEVKNPTKKEIKTSVKVTIAGGKTDPSGEGQGADDGEKPESSNAREN